MFFWVFTMNYAYIFSLIITSFFTAFSEDPYYFFHKKEEGVIFHTQRTVRSQLKRMTFFTLSGVCAYTAYRAFKYVEPAADGNFPSWWQPVFFGASSSDQKNEIFLNHCMKVGGATILVGVLSSISALYCLRHALRP